MTATPIVVIQHHLNLTGQNVLTFVSWALTIILLAVTIEMGRRERSPFYVLVVLAAMAGAFAEALYDVAFSLYFYSTHGMQTFYTAFDIPQPVWTHSGYAVLYALPAVLITYRIRRGLLTPRALYAWADPRRARQPGGGLPVHRTQHRLRGHPGSLRCRVRAGI